MLQCFVGNAAMTVVLMKDGLRTPPFHHYQDLDCQTVVFLSLCPQCPAGSSSVCVFCKDRVYVMERLSAEGLFFHRSCFQCNFCGDTLKLTGYTFDQQHGQFSTITTRGQGAFCVLVLEQCFFFFSDPVFGKQCFRAPRGMSNTFTFRLFL